MKDQPPRILVVDDDEMLRRSMARLLSSLGIRHVDESGDGEHALRLLRDGTHPNIILCDLRMPGMDGVAFLRHVAEAGFRGQLIIVSGEDERFIAAVGNLARVHGLSLIGVLEKPVRRSNLESLLIAAGSVRFESSPSARPGPIGAAELRRLIDGGAVRVVFQPKVSMATREVVGVEALCRIEARPGVLLAPAAFIPTAENHDLMTPLTITVVHRALDQVERWEADGLTLDVAIDFNADSLKRPEFPEFLSRWVARSKLQMSRLTVELTESQVIDDQTLPLEVLNRLHLKGATLSVDDFGTGYSSFLRLRQIPFQELKLDRTFVSEALRDRAARAVIEASIDLAQALGMDVVAEGVETAEEWAFLERAGVDEAQGYLIAEPMAGPALRAWVREGARIDGLTDT